MQNACQMVLLFNDAYECVCVSIGVIAINMSYHSVIFHSLALHSFFPSASCRTLQFSEPANCWCNGANPKHYNTDLRAFLESF